MTTYKWVVDDVQTIPFFGGQYNVVRQISWHMVGTAGVTTAMYYGMTNLDLSDLSDFVPYADVTNDDMIGWLESAVDVDWVKSIIDAKIQQSQALPPSNVT